MNSIDDEKEKIQELLSLDKVRKKLSRELIDKLEAIKGMLQFENVYKAYISKSDKDINEYLTKLFEAEGEEFIHYYLDIKSNLNVILQMLKTMYDKINKVNETSLRKILKRVLLEKLSK